MKISRQNFGDPDLIFKVILEKKLLNLGQKILKCTLSLDWVS